MRRVSGWYFGALLLLLPAVSGCQRSDAAAAGHVQVQVYAAASTAHVIEPLAAHYEQATGVVVYCNSAASSTLAGVPD
jgi:ABC-type molybdate transport system substrate-binding protein